MQLDRWQAGIAAALDGYDGLRPIVPAGGLDIHLRNSVGARLSVLRDRFPVVAQVLGQRYFSALASRYVALNVSTSPDLDSYGATFPDWLAAEIPARAELAEMHYLADLADLERAWAKACRTPLVPASWASRTPFVTLVDAVRPCLNPTLTWLTTRYDVFGLWNNHRQGHMCSTIRDHVDPQHLAIYRLPKDEPRVENIDDSLAAVLAVIEARGTLGELAGRCSVPALAECVERGYVLGWEPG